MDAPQREAGPLSPASAAYRASQVYDSSPAEYIRLVTTGFKTLLKGRTYDAFLKDMKRRGVKLRNDELILVDMLTERIEAFATGDHDRGLSAEKFLASYALTIDPQSDRWYSDATHSIKRLVSADVTHHVHYSDIVKTLIACKGRAADKVLYVLAYADDTD